MRGTRPSDPAALPRDAGMTLVEVLVAMTIFAVFAAAFAPVVLQGLIMAQKNAVQVTANQTAAEIIDAIIVETTCAAITARGGAWSGGVEAQGGETLAVSVVLDTCPTSFPGTVRVTVSVTGVDVETTAETLVLVQGG